MSKEKKSRFKIIFFERSFVSAVVRLLLRLSVELMLTLQLTIPLLLNVLKHDTVFFLPSSSSSSLGRLRFFWTSISVFDFILFVHEFRLSI